MMGSMNHMESKLLSPGELESACKDGSFRLQVAYESHGTSNYICVYMHI